MAHDLIPCPYCKAGETQIRAITHWTGQRSEVISVEVRHWCVVERGIRGSTVVMRGKTEAEAIARWNHRP